MEVWKRNVSAQVKVELRNGTDWMWTVCECVFFFFFFPVCLRMWLCGEGWPVSSEGKIDSKPDEKWCDWGRMCRVCTDKSVPCARACGGVDVHKDSGGNLRSNAFLSWLVWTGIPGAQLAARVGPRCACHVILMPFSFLGWDLGCSVKCMWVRVNPLLTALPGLTADRQEIRACGRASLRSPEAAASKQMELLQSR